MFSQTLLNDFYVDIIERVLTQLLLNEYLHEYYWINFRTNIIGNVVTKISSYEFLCKSYWMSFTQTLSNQLYMNNIEWILQKNYWTSFIQMPLNELIIIEWDFGLTLLNEFYTNIIE